METIEPPVSASTNTEHEINFLLVRDRSGDWPRWKQAAVGSVAFHLVAITALFLIKGGGYEPLRPENLEVPRVIHLYVPKELTQKAPNKGPVAKLLLTAPAAPTPKRNEPAPKVAKAPPPPPAPAPVQQKPIVPVPVAPPAPNPAELATNQPPAASPPPVALPNPQAPRMIVEDSMHLNAPAPRPGSLSTTVNPIQEAMRSMGNPGTGTAGTRAGDAELSVAGGIRLPASAARLSNFQLKSDPMGVDFAAYLQRVLAAVKLNWSAVYPTAARLGQRGIVSIDFAIGKDGTVGKIVWGSHSGSNALDNASVAAISASNPLPPLPADFKGDRIVVQMSFMYNIPK